jgi:hypothetical protein
MLAQNYQSETIMKILMGALALVSTVGLGSTAEAKGAVKGAAVGAAAGHMVGHGHAVAGAAAGAAVGHHHAKVNTRKAASHQN